MKPYVKKITAAENDCLYKVKLNSLAEAIQRGSRGLNNNLAKYSKLAGTWICVVLDNGRFFSVANALGNNDFSFPRGSGAYYDLSVEHIVNHPENDTYICTRCGQVMHAENAENHDCKSHCPSCGAPLVNGKCETCLRKKFATVYGYHGAPSELRNPRFTSPDKRDKKLHMGIEIEFCTNGLTSRDTLAKNLEKIWDENPIADGNFMHFETDCSLSGNGFEMISNPLTLREYRKQATRFEAAFKYISEHGGHMAGAGSHIHIDRRFFNGNDVAASLYIGSYVAKYWDDLFSKLANGATNQYSRPIAYDGGSIIAYVGKFFQNGRGHGTAVNIDNSATIELRLWRGTLDYTDTLAYLDITQAIAQWAKHRTDSNFTKVKAADLFRWCSAPANTWAYVQRHITDATLLVEIRNALDQCDGTDYD